MLIRLSTAVFAVVFLASCSGTGNEESAKKPAASKPAAKTKSPFAEPQSVKRVYDERQAARGEKLFIKNCEKCHGMYAEGDPYWQQKNKEGKFPPPPLDGTAHAWHHPTEILHKMIKDGGKELGGTMEGFEGKLSDAEITDIIVWMTSLWPEEVYATWYRRDQITRNYKETSGSAK
jgi:mono/diheme cytochrome c family protein